METDGCNNPFGIYRSRRAGLVGEEYKPTERWLARVGAAVPPVRSGVGHPLGAMRSGFSSVGTNLTFRRDRMSDIIIYSVRRRVIRCSSAGVSE